MQCVNEQSLQMFVDNELDGAESALVADHLRTCAPCSREIANVVRLKRATHQAGQRYAPSAAFQRKMMAKVAGAPKAQRWWTRVMMPAAALALVLVMIGSALYLSQERSAIAGRELADLHVSTIASEHPVDVISTDKHTVKPWFAGKLPFTFNLPELQGSEYQMIGGRMAYIAQAPAAQVIFQHGKHHCSLFIMEDRAGIGSNIRAPMNFTTISWKANGLVYIMITDASPDTMRDLAERIKKA